MLSAFHAATANVSFAIINTKVFTLCLMQTDMAGTRTEGGSEVGRERGAIPFARGSHAIDASLRQLQVTGVLFHQLTTTFRDYHSTD